MRSFFSMGSSLTGAYFQMHLAIFIWGFTGVLGKLISLPESSLVWYRVAIASVFMLLFFRGKVQKVSKQDVLPLVLQGMVLSLHWLAFYAAIKYANVSITLCCMASSAFFTSLLEPLFFKKRINTIEIGLGLVVLLGIMQIFYAPVRSDAFVHLSLGIGLGIVAALLSALVTILSKQYSSQYNGYTLTFYQITTGFLLLSVWAPFHIISQGIEAWLPTQADMIYLLIMGIICTVIACTLALNSLQYLSSYTMTLNINLEPVYGILLAFVIFKENEYFNKHFYWGAGVILVALMAHSVYMLRKPRAS